MLAGAAALLIVRLALDLLLGMMAQQLGGAGPFWMDATPSADTFLFVGVLAVAAAAIAGLLPAVRATGWMIGDGLRTSGAGGEARLGGTWNFLVVAQVAFSVAALPTVVEMGWGTLRPGALGPGFPAEDYLAVRVEMDRDLAVGDLTPEDQQELSSNFAAALQELKTRVGAEPGVIAVTTAATVPAEERWALIGFEVVDGNDPALPPPPIQQATQIQSARVEPDYFDAFDMSVVTGRRFTPGDLGSEQFNILVDRAFVSGVLGGRNPLGLRLHYLERTRNGLAADRSPSYEIVGVVDDLPQNRMYGKIYHPVATGDVYPASLLIRTAPPPETMATRIRQIALDVDPTLRLEEVQTLDGVFREQSIGNNIGAFALAISTLSVLLLCAGGIYALMSFTVSQRRREIGIRAALGARSARLLAGIFSRAATQLGLGALLGGVVATLIGIYIPIEELGGFPVRGVLPATAVLMIVIGLLAALGPARRGLRIEPTEAMRADL